MRTIILTTLAVALAVGSLPAASTAADPIDIACHSITGQRRSSGVERRPSKPPRRCSKSGGINGRPMR